MPSLRWFHIFMVPCLAVAFPASPASAADDGWLDHDRLEYLITSDGYEATPPGPPKQSGYVALRGGIGLSQKTDLDIGGGAQAKSAYDPGAAGSIAFGFDRGDISLLGKVRLEAEFMAGWNDIDKHEIGGLGTFNSAAQGDLWRFAGFANVIHDFAPEAAIRPFLGGGIGLAYARLDDYRAPGLSDLIDDGAFGFAWQIMAGVNVPVAEHLDLELFYRYQRIESLFLTTGTGAGAATNSLDISTHAFMAGLRYSFP